MSAAVGMIDRSRRVQFIGHGNLSNAGRTRVADQKTSGSDPPQLRMSSLVFSFLRKRTRMVPAAAAARLVSDGFFGYINMI